MLICAIDTSGREGSLALARGDANSFEILHSAPIAGGTYSAQLIPALTVALEKSGRTKSEIGLLVVASGPGSFTGLRVGLSTVKALAEVLHVPVVGLSVLETIAFSTGEKGMLLAALDAQRSEVFVGEYDVTGDEITMLHEALSSVNDFTIWLSARNPAPPTYTPDSGLADKVKESGALVQVVTRPGADVYARLGLQKFLAGATSEIETLDANYIRRSDAEIFSAPKLGINTRKK